MKPGDYMDLLHCETPEQVYERVSDWSSELTPREHLVRSTILDIQASLEGLLKNVYYQVLLTVLFQGEDEAGNEKAKDDLFNTITKMNFSSMFRVMRPLLKAFPSTDLEPIQSLNDLRNKVAHRQDMSKIEYKGRDPFNDADCLAQVYLDAWAARAELRKFYERMIEDPRALSAHYRRFYEENYDKPRKENNSAP